MPQLKYRVAKTSWVNSSLPRCNPNGKIGVTELYNAFKMWAEQSREGGTILHCASLAMNSLSVTEYAVRSISKAACFQGVSLQVSLEDRALDEIAEMI